ncbi:MAG: hypothetical protein HC866_03575 [Leptolyngbyaceae cyanobacterium RU_5_1]|nr:hypothetical protein [Leptolyngbyaceae cyanobacterium RU_5_1]
MQRWLVGSSSRKSPHHPYRLIALIGMGGIGKTALAVKLVEQLVETREKEPSLTP